MPADLAARAEIQARAALDIASPTDSVFVVKPRDLHLTGTDQPDRLVADGIDRWAARHAAYRWSTASLEDA